MASGFIFGDELRRYLSAADICVDRIVEPVQRSFDHDQDDGIHGARKANCGIRSAENRFTAQEAAVYVPNNDERAFARALAQLMNDPVRRKSLGAVGSRRIETELAWDYSIPKLLEAYQKVWLRRLEQAGLSCRNVELRFRLVAGPLVRASGYESRDPR